MKDIKIMIQLEPDGWHVIAQVDGSVVERSPALPDRDTAIEKAEIVQERFEAKFGRLQGRWRKT